jgi:hypothetical protein
MTSAEQGTQIRLSERSLVADVGWQHSFVASGRDLDIGSESIGIQRKIVDCAETTGVDIGSGEDRRQSRQVDGSPSG